MDMYKQKEVKKLFHSGFQRGQKIALMKNVNSGLKQKQVVGT
jgi:hypothetical protein